MIRSILCKPYDKHDIDILSRVTVSDKWNADDPYFGPDCVVTRSCPLCPQARLCTGHIGVLMLETRIINPIVETVVLSMLSRVCYHCKIGNAEEAKKCSTCARGLNNIRCSSIPSRSRTCKDVIMLDFDAIATLLLECFPEIDWLKGCFIDRIIIPPRFMRQISEDRKAQSSVASAYDALINAVKSKKKISVIYERYKTIVGPGNDGQADDSVLGSITGKYGIFRDLMIGKRVDECGRAVIVADDSIAVDEVLVPKKMADRIRISIHVNHANIDHIRKMVLSGKILDIQGRPTTVMDIKPDARFVRALQDGDRIMVNRQPTLTRNSLLSMKVRVSRDNRQVIGINTAVTPSFNADFDGDEMNLFFQDDITSMAEVQCLMAAGDNIISPGTSKPVINPVQDTITCIYMLTRKVSTITKDMYSQCYVWCDGYIHRQQREYTTLDLVSLCIPPVFNYSMYGVDIICGMLMHGTIDKRALSSGSESIISVMTLVYGGSTSIAFISKLQRLSSWVTMSMGMALSYRDICDDGDINLSSDIISPIRGKKWTSHVHALAASSACRNSSERHVQAWLSSADSSTNVMNAMVASGSKGNITNLAQIRIMVGQQLVMGKMPNNSKTTSGDCDMVDGLKDNGMCLSSYIKGLSPREYMFHQMAGREGVVRVNISTSVSGYQSRRLTKPLSCVTIGYNNGIYCTKYPQGSDERHTTKRLIRIQHGMSAVDQGKCLNGDIIVTRNVLDNL